MCSVRNSLVVAGLAALALAGCTTTGPEPVEAAPPPEPMPAPVAASEIPPPPPPPAPSRPRTGAVRGAGDGYDAIVYGGNAAALARIAKGTEFASGTGICLVEGEELTLLTRQGLVALGGGDCRRFGRSSSGGSLAGAGMNFRVVTRGSSGALAIYPLRKKLPLDEMVCLKAGDQLTLTDTRGRTTTYGAGCDKRLQATEEENTGGTTHGALDPAATGRRAAPQMGQ